jgi:hypothetical protein
VADLVGPILHHSGISDEGVELALEGGSSGDGVPERGKENGGGRREKGEEGDEKERRRRRPNPSPLWNKR